MVETDNATGKAIAIHPIRAGGRLSTAAPNL
jgi:hypothetical protein